jgi:hypothetical protein
MHRRRDADEVSPMKAMMWQSTNDEYDVNRHTQRPSV